MGNVTDRVVSRELAGHHAYGLAPCVEALAMHVCFENTHDFSYNSFPKFVDCLSENAIFAIRKQKRRVSLPK